MVKSLEQRLAEAEGNRDAAPGSEKPKGACGVPDERGRYGEDIDVFSRGRRHAERNIPDSSARLNFRHQAAQLKDKKGDASNTQCRRTR
jgi:hypothetical protein